MKQHDLASRDIPALFNKAGIGQDGTSIHLSFETEEEADEAFAYISELGSTPKPTEPDWTAAWKEFNEAAKKLAEFADREGDTVTFNVTYKLGRKEVA